MIFRGYRCGPRPEGLTKVKSYNSYSPVDRQKYTRMIHDDKTNKNDTKVSREKNGIIKNKTVSIKQKII